MYLNRVLAVQDYVYYKGYFNVLSRCPYCKVYLVYSFEFCFYSIELHVPNMQFKGRQTFLARGPDEPQFQAQSSLARRPYISILCMYSSPTPDVVGDKYHGPLNLFLYYAGHKNVSK